MGSGKWTVEDWGSENFWVLAYTGRMDTIIAFLLGNFNIWTPILAILIGVLSFGLYKRGGAAICSRILTAYLFLAIGLMGVENFIIHAFYGNFAAASIGWQPSPFQYEVAIANLAVGLMGVIAAFTKNLGYRAATVTGFAVWFLGDAAGHIYQLIAKHDHAAYNAGTTLYSDIYLPVIAIILLIVVWRGKK